MRRYVEFRLIGAMPNNEDWIRGSFADWLNALESKGYRFVETTETGYLFRVRKRAKRGRAVGVQR